MRRCAARSRGSRTRSSASRARGSSSPPIEYTEERARVGQQLALLLVAGIGCLLFALFFAAAAVVIYFWDTNRFAAILGVVAVLRRRRARCCCGAATEIAQTSPTPFAATVAELDKDRAALARTMNLPPQP